MEVFSMNKIESQYPWPATKFLNNRYMILEYLNNKLLLKEMEKWL